MSKCTYCGDEYGTNPGTWCPECQGWQKCWDEVSALVTACVAEYDAIREYERAMGYNPASGDYGAVRQATLLRISRTANYIAAREPYGEGKIYKAESGDMPAPYFDNQRPKND